MMRTLTRRSSWSHKFPWLLSQKMAVLLIKCQGSATAKATVFPRSNKSRHAYPNFETIDVKQKTEEYGMYTVGFILSDTGIFILK